jgi:hypothetical protein
LPSLDIIASVLELAHNDADDIMRGFGPVLTMPSVVAEGSLTRLGPAGASIGLDVIFAMEALGMSDAGAFLASPGGASEGFTAKAESLLLFELERTNETGRAGCDSIDRVFFSSAGKTLSSICGWTVETATAAATTGAAAAAVESLAVLVVDMVDVDFSLLALPSSCLLDFFFLSLLDLDLLGLF